MAAASAPKHVASKAKTDESAKTASKPKVNTKTDDPLGGLPGL